MGNPSKWYSAALKAAEMLPQPSGTGSQMMSLLRKYGAKPSELSYLKVPEAMNQMGAKVSKKELLDYIDKNKVLPEEMVKSGPSGLSKNDYVDMLANDPEMFQSEMQLNDNAMQEFQTPSRRLHYISQERYNDIDDLWSDFNTSYPDVNGEGGTQYHGYATYPQSGYKETLLTLPLKKPRSANKAAQVHFDLDYNQLDAAQRGFIDDSLKRYPEEDFASPLYQSSHWEEPNVLLHTRTSTAPVNEKWDMVHGSKSEGQIPFLEELQSDWGQAGRSQGFNNPQIESLKQEYYDKKKAVEDWWNNNGGNELETHADQVYLGSRPEFQALTNARQQAWLHYSGAREVGGDVNPAPLVTNTNDWASAGIRSFLYDAAKQGADQVGWTPGVMNNARYGRDADRLKGMQGFYDQMIPNIISKYTKPYGGTINPAGVKTVTKYHVVPTYAEPGNELYYNGLGSYDDPSLARHRIQNSMTPQGWKVFPVETQSSGSNIHTATLPDDLRQKLLSQGIPFFRKGGMT